MVFIFQELPKEISPVQRAFNINAEDSLIISVKVSHEKSIHMKKKNTKMKQNKLKYT